MKKLRHLAILVIITISCETRKEIKHESSVTPDSQAATFLDKVEIELAKHFSVSYHENYKVISLSGEFTSDKGREIKYDKLVLVQKDTEVSDLSKDLVGAHVIFIPVEKVAVNVQHSESFLRELGLVDKLVAVGGAVSYADSIRYKALDGSLGQVGYSWHSPPNLEVLLNRKADLFLMTYADLTHSTALNKCRELGVSTAPVFDWAEDHYLAKAEWIKFYSLFFNEEKKANKVFKEIKERVTMLKTLVSTIPIQETAFWAHYKDKNSWLVRLNTFEVNLMRDAGLTNPLENTILANPVGSQSIYTEELIEKAKDIDHWFIGDIHSSKLPPEYMMNSFKAWRTGNLYHNMKRSKPEVNASDWYATALVRPDYILSDLVKLVHPDLLPDPELFFMGVFDKKTKFPVLKSMN